MDNNDFLTLDRVTPIDADQHPIWEGDRYSLTVGFIPNGCKFSIALIQTDADTEISSLADHAYAYSKVGILEVIKSWLDDEGVEEAIRLLG